LNAVQVDTLKSELDVIASELSNLELAAQEERQEAFYALTSEQVSQASFLSSSLCHVIHEV